MVCAQIKKQTVSLLYNRVDKAFWTELPINIFKNSLWYKLIA